MGKINKMQKVLKICIVIAKQVKRDHFQLPYVIIN